LNWIKKTLNFLEKSSGLNFKCIDYPTPVKQIKIFDRVNNVSVNVFGLNDKNFIFPLYVNSIEKKNHFDLFLFGNDKTLQYYYINNFSRLIRSQKTKHKSALIICKSCFTTFGEKPCKNKLWSNTGLIEHKKKCAQHKLGRPVMFENGDNNFIQFTNFKRTQWIPIVIYADFECLLKRVQRQQTKTYITHIHKPMKFGFYIKIDYNIIPKHFIKKFKIPRKLTIYRGKNAAKHFMKKTENEESFIFIGSNQQKDSLHEEETSKRSSRTLIPKAPGSSESHYWSKPNKNRWHIYTGKGQFIKGFQPNRLNNDEFSINQHGSAYQTD